MSLFVKLVTSLKKVFKGREKRNQRQRQKPRQRRRNRALVRRKIKKQRRIVKVRKPLRQTEKPAEGVLAGEITHFFPRIQVAVVKVTRGSIQLGDRLHIKCPRTDFVQKVSSLQIESVDVKIARKGQLVGLKVSQEARPKDRVFKLS